MLQNTGFWSFVAERDLCQAKSSLPSHEGDFTACDVVHGADNLDLTLALEVGHDLRLLANLID